MKWVHCTPLIQRSVRIKQLREFLKSDHWLRRYYILSGGVFYFEPPCRVIKLCVGEDFVILAGVVLTQVPACDGRTDRWTTRPYLYTVCGKKVSPKVFCHFLSNRSEFLHEISHIYYLLIHNHIKLLSSIVLFLIMTKLLNFLGDHVVISDVHAIFTERRTHHIL